MKHQQLLLPLITVLCLAIHTHAQDLDPRAYVRVPIKTTIAVGGFAFSHGGVVTDPTLPIQNIKAKVQASSLGVVHSFGLFGLSSQVLVAVPYSWAQVSGEVGSLDSSVTRNGLADTRLRFTVLLRGAPAATIADFKKATQKTIVGLSINVVAPTGQFFSNKLINIGTHRWAFRPELGISQPIGKRWFLDFYSGLWLFTKNNTFYPGTSERSQAPMGAFQTHLSYNIKPTMWIAINATYYTGGQSKIDDKLRDDRQSNARIGITCLVPTGRLSSLKLAASTGAIVRIGQDFTSYSIGWQKSWIKGLKKLKQPAPAK